MAFSYFIAIFIPFLIGELTLVSIRDMLLVGGVSSFLTAIFVISLNRFNYHLKKIPEEIKRLRKS